MSNTSSLNYSNFLKDVSETSSQNSANLVDSWDLANNWQIFLTPAGFASTNNLIESFNKQLKSIFVNYKKSSLLKFNRCVVEDIIPYYSINNRYFQ